MAKASDFEGKKQDDLFYFVDYSPEEAERVVSEALEAGYRHIDTAQAYGNEAGVGEGIRTCGISRDELFVTSKVAAENKSYDSAAQSIDETLRKTGLDYIDMMIIHSPQPWAEFRGEKRCFEENREVWRALEDAYKAGKVRAIGVSNFLEDDLENILNSCGIKPMVNQILAHISNTPLSLIDFCNKNGIQTEAYSPIAHGEALNHIGEGLSLAVDDRMKSERMKTELITNVSHDLKTPLTSIVNYVDLLKKEELTGAAADYVDVLDRQSARLKKLTEDLVEASKASTGNLPVSLETVELGEFLEQVQAEYAARLQKATLEIVAEPTPEHLTARADGRYRGPD